MGICKETLPFDSSPNPRKSNSRTPCDTLHSKRIWCTQVAFHAPSIVSTNMIRSYWPISSRMVCERVLVLTNTKNKQSAVSSDLNAFGKPLLSPHLLTCLSYTLTKLSKESTTAGVRNIIFQNPHKGPHTCCALSYLLDR